MRKQIRPGLDGDDFNHDSYVKPVGSLIIPAHRNDLNLWFDQVVFPYDMRRGDPLPLFVRHAKCSTGQSLTIRYSTDRPKHYIVCPLCFKKWELHQLENMRPQDFSSVFEYVWTPKEKWPYSIFLTSNGVSKYNCTVYANYKEAAEYYYKEFIAFKNNRFKWSEQ